MEEWEFKPDFGRFLVKVKDTKKQQGRHIAEVRKLEDALLIIKVHSMKAALERIAACEDHTVTERVDIGSCGERDHYRQVALEALK